MLRLLGFTALVLSLLPTMTNGRSEARTKNSYSIAAVFSLCRAHPSAHFRPWVHGWFVPGASASSNIVGGLFDSRQAVPLTTVNQWDVQGHWKRYGALFVQIGTQASFGPRELMLHGRLDCASFSFQTDRDPFAPPRLKAVYGNARTGTAGRATWVTAGGVKLTLTVPRQVYPRNALAQVHVALQNVSQHTVWFWSTGIGLLGFASPQAEVLDQSGRIVFPPAMAYMPALPGPPPSPVPLQPGKKIGASEYIVVRGARIRATEDINTSLSNSLRRAANTIATRPITVRLTSEQPPQLTLHESNGGPIVDVVRPPYLSGRPLLLDYADCRFPLYSYSYGWNPSGLHLTPGCAPVQAWHIRLAWLDHPVAALDYTSPVSTPTPLPAPTPAPTSTPTSAPSLFADLLHRAFVAMKRVHSVHADAIHSYVDSSSATSLRITTDCQSSATGSIPVTLRTLASGRQTGAGIINRGFIVTGPSLSGLYGTVHIWHRNSSTHQSWQPYALSHLPGWGLLGTATVANPPLYLNQACPDLIRLTYLSSPLPYWSHRVIGTRLLQGRRVWLLREQQYSKLDLYVDASSYRLLRLAMWDGTSKNPVHWQVRFDYSRFNESVHLLPYGSQEKRS